MPYAVTLPLDPAAAAAAEALGRALAERLGNGAAPGPGYPPHLTLAVLPDAAPLGRLEGAVAAAARRWSAAPLLLAGIGVFPGTSPVIWAAPVVTADLLAWHGALCADLAPLEIDPHYRPDGWVPHVTLREGASASLDQCMAVLARAWTGPIRARLAWLELVRFRPVERLRREALRAA